MPHRISAPTELSEPFYQAELGVSYESLIALERDRGSDAVRQTRDLRGNLFLLGRPQAWRLGASELLVQIACSFLGARDHHLLSTRLETRFETPEQESCRVEDLYPRHVDEQVAEQTIWVAPTGTGFRVLDEPPRHADGLVVDGLALRPKIVGAGLGTATGMWDFFSSEGGPPEGCKVGYLVLKVAPSAATLTARFAVSALVETPLGILPFTVKRQMTESSECSLDLRGLSGVAGTAAAFHRDPAPAASAPTIKILFLAANPSDTTPLKLDEEVRAIDGALQCSEFGHRFDIRQHWAVSVDDLQGLILRHDPDIVHFCGHGSLAKQILLEDESRNKHPVPPAALSRLFALLKGRIRCVVLNACLTVEQARAIARHVDSVVGMSRVIGDPAAISFASAFYQALGYGKSVRTAFELGCNLMEIKNLEEQDAPELFAERTDPKAILFVEDARKKS